MFKTNGANKPAFDLASFYNMAIQLIIIIAAILVFYFTQIGNIAVAIENHEGRINTLENQVCKNENNLDEVKRDMIFRQGVDSKP